MTRLAKRSNTKKRNKAYKQHAQREKQALESLGQKRRPFEPLLKEIVAAVLHAEGPERRVTAEESASASSSATWVEVGSGLGQLRGLLPRVVQQCVTHTELSEALVRGLLERHPDAHALAANVTELPFESASVDAVLGLCVFDSFPEPELAVREIGRVLRTGGRFIHFLDAATNIEPILDGLVSAGHLPLPNFFADIALRRSELLEAMDVEHLIQPYHDILSVPVSQFQTVTAMLQRTRHPLAGMFQRYMTVFLRKPFEPLTAARAFVRLTSDPSTGRPMNQALMSLFTTLQEPQYARHMPFELRSMSSLAYFKAKLERQFGADLGFEVKRSNVVYSRSFEADAESTLRARIRRVGIGQNSLEWPEPLGIPAHQLDPKLPKPKLSAVAPESHVLREAAIYCLVAEKMN